MNENYPAGQSQIDDLVEYTEKDRQWFFEVNGRFPVNDNEMEDFLDYKLEEININQAEEAAQEDL
jgi:hypothetical protein